MEMKPPLTPEIVGFLTSSPRTPITELRKAAAWLRKRGLDPTGAIFVANETLYLPAEVARVIQEDAPTPF
ncbi:hypothetical protein [Mesorhizobium xinjiangense]|uniref:hypothetical protein n=1 Tax=Mesorhizobium xinjiangense TaxID=2678685 RepID=UPI0012EDAEE0|nr:hypothetical protein [Mesorhizobium xinjiangense]